MSDLPPLIAVSLKMYLGVASTRAWVAQVVDVRARLETDAAIELAVLPTFPLLESTAKALAGTGIRWGAQDVAASVDGAQTGEVSVEVLAEVGCRYVEIGHVERRRLFGEDDAMVQAKVSQVVGAGLVPLYCLGEVERGAPP
jgi:triosephosphate isomerase